MTEVTWTITRIQLIDALANIEVRDVKTSGPAKGLVVAEDMADAILSQLQIVSHRETATAAAITKAERERIRQLAIRYNATWLRPCDDGDQQRTLHTHHLSSFADLLREG
jgi:hypothetical protein